MKRQFYWMGRAGTVLLVVGVAVALVTFIPPAGGSTIGASGRFPPIAMSEVMNFPYLITPQQQIKLTVEAEGLVLVHILEVSQDYLLEWIIERFPELRPGELNITVMEAFLDAHPDSVIFTDEDRTISWVFTPKRLLKVIAVMTNVDDDPSGVSYEWRVERSTILVPVELSLPQSLVLVTLGIVLALPWTVSTVSTRRSPQG